MRNFLNPSSRSSLPSPLSRISTPGVEEKTWNPLGERRRRRRGQTETKTVKVNTNAKLLKRKLLA